MGPLTPRRTLPLCCFLLRYIGSHLQTGPAPGVQEEMWEGERERQRERRTGERVEWTERRKGTEEGRAGNGGVWWLNHSQRDQEAGNNYLVNDRKAYKEIKRKPRSGEAVRVQLNRVVADAWQSMGCPEQTSGSACILSWPSPAGGWAPGRSGWLPQT